MSQSSLSLAEADNPATSGVKLPLSICVGWGIGSIGMMTLLNVTNGLILKYVVDYLGLTAAFAGGLIAFTRIFDAVIDPAMGTISDNTRSRWGRRLPYLLLGGVLCALTPVVMFALPTAFGPSWFAPLVVFGLFFYSVAHTAFNVPYMAMPVEMTQNPQERTYLFSFRIYGTALGALAGNALAPWLITRFGGDASGFAQASYVLGAIILLACLLCFWMTRKAPAVAATQTGDGPGLKDLKLVLGNKPFLYLLLAKIFIVGGTTVGASAMAFFVTKGLGRELAQLSLLALPSTAGLFLSQPLWVRSAKLYGKRASYLIAASLYIVLVMSWLLATADEPQFLFIARALILGIAGGGILLTSQAMLPDCLEHEYQLTGLRHEGAMTGFYTTIERGASAMGVALAGLILSLGGYQGGTETVDAGALRAIYACVAVVPGLMLLASMGAIFRYDLKG